MLNYCMYIYNESGYAEQARTVETKRGRIEGSYGMYRIFTELMYFSGGMCRIV